MMLDEKPLGEVTDGGQAVIWYRFQYKESLVLLGFNAG